MWNKYPRYPTWKRLKKVEVEIVLNDDITYGTLKGNYTRRQKTVLTPKF